MDVQCYIAMLLGVQPFSGVFTAIRENKFAETADRCSRGGDWGVGGHGMQMAVGVRGVVNCDL